MKSPARDIAPRRTTGLGVHWGMSSDRDSLKPIPGAERALRRRLDLKDEILLALLPTVVVLMALGLVEAFSRQRLLFSSLASSAFLIYLDPQHGTNRIRTLVASHLTAAVIGLAFNLILGPGYWSAGCAMVLTIAVMILLDVVHPPAASTALGFAFRAADESSPLLFAMAVGMIAALVAIERYSVWWLARAGNREERRAKLGTKDGTDSDRPGG